MLKSTSTVLAMVMRRLGLGLLSLVLVSLIIFIAVNALPGDFASAVLGRDATPEAVERLRVNLGLQLPWWERYVAWLGSMLTGNFGTSFTGRPVTAVIGPRFGNTIRLALATAVIAVPLAVMFGVICTRFRNRLPDRILSMSTLTTISMPEFFVAYLLLLVLSVKLGLFPTLSSIRPGFSFGDLVYRMTLPVLTLLFVTLAHMMRSVRAALITEMSKPYVEMLKLSGVPETRLILTQVLPNVVGPIASVVAISLAYLVAGVVVVEVVFVYPGIGQTMVDAVRNRDIPVIQTCALIFSAAYILLNLLADVLGIVTNPRLLHPR